MHWVQKFINYTEGMNSPELFRKWAAIAAISGALERRVWLTIPAFGKCYPNIFVLLVAPPGVGKTSVLTKVQDLWRETNRLVVAPDNVSKAAFLDVMARSTKSIMLPDLTKTEQSAVQVCSGEFGNFVPAYETLFLNVLNTMWDCPSVYVDEKRVKSVTFPNPQLTMIAGTQPAFLNTLLPEEAFGMGFMSRMLMIYVNTPNKVNLWHSAYTDENEHELHEDVFKFTELLGECSIDQAARDKMSEWYSEGCPPVPNHSKLKDYVVRRLHNVQKLMIISAVGRSSTLAITGSDFDIALGWLLEAEGKMPDIFRAMKGRSDDEVLKELHNWMWGMFTKDKKALHESRLISFMRSRVPSEKILGLLLMAEKSGMIAKSGDIEGTAMYVPRANMHWESE